MVLFYKANGTTITTEDVAWLLDYAVTYPDTTVRYKASQMFLRIHINASYQLETESHSRADGNLFLGLTNYNDTKKNLHSHHL